MDPKYTRKSTITSISNGENNTNVINENVKNNKLGKFRELIKYWDKYVYTFCILINYLNYGICSGLFPPAMVDMKFLFHTSMAKINYVNTFSSVGYLTGSLCGFLYKYINRQMSFIINMIILGVFVGVEPICTSLWQFYAAMFINSLGAGVWDSGNSVWVVEIWKQHSAPVLNLSQMMYGLGMIIAPLLVRPFIYGDLSNKTDTSGTTPTIELTTLATFVTTNITDSDDINYSVDRRSKLKIPFMIGGGVTLIGPIILLVMFFVKRYKISEKRENQNTETLDQNSNKNNLVYSPQTRKLLIALVALSLTAYSSLEMTFFNYSATYYQYLPIHLSAPKAATVMSVMTATYAAGRGVSALVSSKLKPEIMLTYHMVILSISLAVLYLGQNSETIIFIGNALIGFGFSAMWPSYFSFSERYIKLTNKITSIYSFASSLLALAAPFILGPLIENDPQIMLNLEIGTFAVVVILFIIIMVVVKKSQRNQFIVQTLN